MEGSSDIACVPSTHSMDTVCAKGLFVLCNQRRNFPQALTQEVAEQRPELSSSHHLPTDPHPSLGLSPWWWWTHPQSLLGIRMGVRGRGCLLPTSAQLLLPQAGPQYLSLP